MGRRDLMNRHRSEAGAGSEERGSSYQAAPEEPPGESASRCSPRKVTSSSGGHVPWSDQSSPIPDAKMIETALRDRTYRLVFQPITRLATGRLFAYEALCRFPGNRSPEDWFRAASQAGIGSELEVVVAVDAIGPVHLLPDGVAVCVNASPVAVASGQLADAIRFLPLDRVIFEITEHAEPDDLEALAEQTRLLQFRGARIAVDDLGAGCSGVQLLLRLSPEIIKLDRRVVSGVPHDSRYRAMIEAIVRFADDTGAEVVAEGIETAAELDVLRAMGVHLGQGWLMGRPVNLETALSRWSLLQHAGLN